MRGWRWKPVDGPKLALEDTDDHVAYEYEVIDAIANCADRCILCAKNVEDHVTCFQANPAGAGAAAAATEQAAAGQAQALQRRPVAGILSASICVSCQGAAKQLAEAQRACEELRSKLSALKEDSVSGENESTASGLIETGHSRAAPSAELTSIVTHHGASETPAAMQTEGGGSSSVKPTLPVKGSAGAADAEAAYVSLVPDTAAKSLVRDVPSADRGNAAENKAGPSSLEQPAKPSAINDDLRQRKDELLLNIKKEVVALDLGTKETMDICDRLRDRASQLFGAYKEYTMSALSMLDREWRVRHDKIAADLAVSDTQRILDVLKGEIVALHASDPQQCAPLVKAVKMEGAEGSSKTYIADFNHVLDHMESSACKNSEADDLWEGWKAQGMDSVQLRIAYSLLSKELHELSKGRNVIYLQENNVFVPKDFIKLFAESFGLKCVLV